MAFVAVVAVVARFARAPVAAELIFVALAAADAWLTAVGAFASFNRNDTIGHLLLPAAIAPLLLHFALRLRMLRSPAQPDGPHWFLAMVAVASFTIALCMTWELVEWLSDSALGTNMSLGYTDTLRDLAAGWVGGLVGSAIAIRLAIGHVSAKARRRRRLASTLEPAVSRNSTGEM
jgi:hypothetical protein